MKQCPLCGGSGEVHEDREIGAALQKERIDSGISLRTLGGRLGLSAAYLSDLEHGKRRWNADRVSRFREGLKNGL